MKNFEINPVFIIDNLKQKGFPVSDVQIQTEEALGFKIATLDEIKELAAQGVFLHYDSIKQVFEN